MKIEEAIQQKNFRNEHQKLQVNVLYTAAWISQQTTQLLKPLNLSWQQFNILRILRGLHPEPASVKILTERMIDKMSNASRLVEKLKQKGLVDRKECPEDRRKVDIVITDKGLEVLAQASRLVETELEEKFRIVSDKDAEAANRILDQMRG